MSKRKARRVHRTAPLSLNEAVNIPLNKLSLSDANVRTIGIDDDGIAELADSIARRSLLQSLMARPILDADGKETGNYEVPGGGRRLRALQLLARTNRLAPDAPIPCIIKADGSALEDSLAENSDRRDLHPLDQYRAFRLMRDSGRAIDDIAAAYAVTPAVVRQRLRLADASPVILEAYGRDELSLEQLMAFCVTTDTDRQEQVYRSFQDQDELPEAWLVRRRLTEQTVSANDRRVRFIGLSTYLQAGGAIMSDLFADDHDAPAYIQDLALLDRLVSEKLAALRDTALAQGWKWCVAAVDVPYAELHKYDQLDTPEPAHPPELMAEYEALTDEHDRLEELAAEEDLSDSQRERIDAIEARMADISNMPPLFADADRARAGVFIRIDPHGNATYVWGAIKPEDAIATPTASDPTSAPESPELDKPALSERLTTDLTAYWTAGLQQALASNYEVAFRTLLHSLVVKLFYRTANSSPLRLIVTSRITSSAPELQDFAAVTAMSQQEESWRKTLPKDEADVWLLLDTMAPEELQMLFAHCVGRLFDATTAHPERMAPDYAMSHRIAADLNFSMTKTGWVTGAANYFERVTKPSILKAVAEAAGDNTAQLIVHLKKSEMAKEAARVVAPTQWLPEVLRVVDPDIEPTTQAIPDSDLEPRDLDDGSELPEFLQPHDADTGEEVSNSTP